MSRFALFAGMLNIAFAGYIVASINSQVAQVENLPLPVDSDTIRIGDDCVVKFDRMRKVPRWVFERLTFSDVNGNANRTGDFHEPQEIPLDFRPSLNSYRNSGYDRGHLAPAADFKADQDAVSGSFSLANMMPQNPQLNRTLWAELESHVRSLVVDSDTVVYVVTVPIWYDGRKASKIAYNTIGQNPIHCPSHVGKAVLVVKNGDISARSWVVPNEKPKPGRKFDEFRVMTDDFERIAGVDVWSFLPDVDEGRIESIR